VARPFLGEKKKEEEVKTQFKAIKKEKPYNHMKGEAHDGNRVESGICPKGGKKEI